MNPLATPPRIKESGYEQEWQAEVTKGKSQNVSGKSQKVRKSQKVSGTNGTVVLLRARNVAYWRTVDFCKLPFVRVGID